MIRVIYANYDKMDRETRLRITMDCQKPPRDIVRKYYTEVAKFKNAEIGHRKNEDMLTLNYLWNLFNSQAHTYGVRSMCIGDIIEIDENRYIVARFGFDKLMFNNSRSTKSVKSI